MSSIEYNGHMLKTFRNKKVAKMVLWGLLILIMPAFVLWGTGSMRNSASRGPKFAGIIDNKKISFDALADSITAIRCQIFLNYYAQPEVMNQLMKNTELIGKMAWDRLLMASEAKNRRIEVKTGELVEYIRSHPIFLRDGKFDEKIYAYILRNNVRLEPRSFEEIVRENLEIKKLNEDIVKDAKIGDGEKTALEEKKNSILTTWLKGLESRATLNISFDDYEKYYR